MRLPRSTTFPICHNRTRFSDSAYSSTSTASSASATSKFPAAHCCDELCCTSTQHSASCGSNVQKKNSGISLSDYDDTSITTVCIMNMYSDRLFRILIFNFNSSFRRIFLFLYPSILRQLLQRQTRRQLLKLL